MILTWTFCNTHSEFHMEKTAVPLLLWIGSGGAIFWTAFLYQIPLLFIGHFNGFDIPSVWCITFTWKGSDTENKMGKNGYTYIYIYIYIYIYMYYIYIYMYMYVCIHIYIYYKYVWYIYTQCEVTVIHMTFQDQYLLSLFCHLHKFHSSIANIVNLWYYCIKHHPKMNQNNVKLTEPSTYWLNFHEFYIYIDSQEIVLVATHFLDEGHKIWKIFPCQILVTQYKFCRLLAETWWGSTLSCVS